MLNLDAKEKITAAFPLRCRTISREPDSLPVSYSLQLKQFKAGLDINLLSSPGFVLTPYLQLMLPPSGWKTGTDAKMLLHYQTCIYNAGHTYGTPDLYKEEKQLRADYCSLKLSH